MKRQQALKSKTKADMNAERQSTASAYLSDAARLTMHWGVLASLAGYGPRAHLMALFRRILLLSDLRN